MVIGLFHMCSINVILQANAMALIWVLKQHFHEKTCYGISRHAHPNTHTYKQRMKKVNVLIIMSLCSLIRAMAVSHESVSLSLGPRKSE